MKISLKQRMILFFSIGFSILLMGFAMIFGAFVLYKVQEQSYDYCDRIVKSNITMIDHYFDQIKTISKMVAMDKDVIDAVTYRNSNSTIDYSIELYNQRKVADKLKQLNVLNTITNGAIIGDKGEYLYYYGQSPNPDYSFATQEWFVNAASTPDYSVKFTNFHYTDYLLEYKDNRTVSLITPILNANQYLFTKRAYLLCDFNLEQLLIQSNSKDVEDVEIGVYDGANPIYFEGKIKLNNRQLSLLNKQLSEGSKRFVIPKEGDELYSYIVINEKSNSSDWHILGIKALTEIEQIKTTILKFTCIMLGVGWCVIVILSILVSQSILEPLQLLVNQFNKIGKGKMEINLRKTKSIEVEQLAKTAQNMIDNIMSLNENLLLEKEKLGQEQLKALQHQINPHFLNNVLQTIKALAICEDVKGISKITTSLGKLLAYSIYKPYDMVDLRDELNYLKNYIEIQNIRYPNKVVCAYECEEHLWEIPVPKLIIQPIVENAFEHAYKGKGIYKLDIIIEETDKDIDIIVTDNGDGIREEELSALNECLQSTNVYKQNKSIGLLNVNQRIKGIYGKQYGIKILSREGNGTSIVINIPKGEGYVKTVNSR